MNKDSLLAAKAQFLTVDYLSSLSESDGMTAELVGREFTIEAVYPHKTLKDYNGNPKIMIKASRNGKVNEWFADSVLTRFSVDSCEAGISIAKGRSFADTLSDGMMVVRFTVTGSTPAVDRNGCPQYRRDALSALKVQKLLKGDYEAYRSREASPEKSEAYRTIAANIEDLFLDSLCTRPGGSLTPENEAKYRLVNPTVLVAEVI